MKKYILFPTLIAMSGMPLTSIVACNPTSPIKPERIFIDKTDFQFFELTDTVKINAFVYPHDSVNELVWESTDPENFPVTQDGQVTWAGKGNYAHIYVHPKGYEYITAACRVNVCFDFEKCDWSTVVFHTNALENGEIDEEQFRKSFYFIDPEQPNIKKIPQDINEFVGHTKKLDVNHVSHEVIVLGIRQDHQKYELDEYEVDRFSEPVIFTFQFNNVICATDKHPLTFQWNEIRNSQNYWQEGQIHDKLNNPNNGVLSMIDDSIVKNNIKTVKRRVNEYFKPEAKALGWYPVMGDEKIFMPVVFDIFDSELEQFMPDYWQNYWNESVLGYVEGWESEAKFIPEPYTYYKNNIDLNDGRIISQKCLIKTDLWNNPCKYWLSSPYGIETKDLSIEYGDLINIIFEDGHSKYCGDFDKQKLEQEEMHTDKWHTIAPCFCI